MWTRINGIGLAAAALAIGCGTTGAPEMSGLVGGRADAFGLELGIYSFEGCCEELAGAPIMLALHGGGQDLPEGYAGHFDYSAYDAEGSEPEYFTGVFGLSSEDGRQRILLRSYDGAEVARFEWSYQDRRLRLDGLEGYLLNLGPEEGVLRKCEAFEVVDYVLEEGFTPWEYPSVRVEVDGQGNYEVSLGSCGYATADEDTIEVRTGEDGELEARVTTAYGSTFVVSIPAGTPSRGRVLHAESGEEPALVANIVCAPAAAEPPPEPTPGPTSFTCTTRRPEANGRTATIRFGVLDLDDPEAMELYWPEDVDSPIAVEPEDSCATTLVYGMADGYLAYRDGRLRIFSDQDGYELGVLELYEDSGFRRGYFRFELMDPDETRFYTEVDCVLD